MRRYFLIILVLFFLTSGKAALSFLPATNEVDATSQAHSFDVSTNVIWTGVIVSYLDCMYPQYTNHWWPWSHAGSGLQGDYQNDEARRLIPFAHDAKVRGVGTFWNLFMAGDDNGGYDSNGVVQWSTNIMNAPTLWYQPAMATTTNEPDITFPSFVHLTAGGIPEDNSAGGGAAQIDRNNAATNLSGVYGTVQLDTWHDSWTNAWSADVVGARKLGFFPGNHPYPAGYAYVGLQHIVALGGETNIGACVVDFNSALVVSTNKMCIVNVVKTGNTISFTVKYDRMPGAWPSGPNQSGCDDMFVAAPYLADLFQWTMSFTNIPDGKYRVSIDSVNTIDLTAANGVLNWNMFSCTNGPLWNQRLAVFYGQLDLEGNDHTTYLQTHTAGDPGVGGNFDWINYISNTSIYGATTGTNYINAMAPYVSGMNALDLLTHNAAQPTNHTFALTPASTLNATTLTVGTAHINQ